MQYGLKVTSDPLISDVRLNFSNGKIRVKSNQGGPHEIKPLAAVYGGHTYAAKR